MRKDELEDNPIRDIETVNAMNPTPNQTDGSAQNPDNRRFNSGSPLDALRQRIAQGNVTVEAALALSCRLAFEEPRPIFPFCASAHTPEDTCDYEMVEMDFGVNARQQANLLYDNQSEAKLAILGSPPEIYIKDTRVAEALCNNITNSPSITTSKTKLVLVNMAGVLLHDGVAEMLTSKVCDPAINKEKKQFVVFCNLSDEPKEQLHKHLKSLCRAALVFDKLEVPHEPYEASVLTYMGRVDSGWKPILQQIHRLKEATSVQIARQLQTPESDISSRLSLLSRNQIVNRRWDKNAAGRGANIYSPIILPVPFLKAHFYPSSEPY